MESKLTDCRIVEYQVLLLFYGQVNGPTKIYVSENWHLSHQGASNEYLQHMFSSRNKKNMYITIWILFLGTAIKSFTQDK